MTFKIRSFFNLIIFYLLYFNIIIFSSESNLEDYPRSDLLLILDKLENNENIIFAKFGDGEYLCMSGVKGANCDGDSYSNSLGKALIKSFIQLSQKKNVFIANWDSQEEVSKNSPVKPFYENLIKNVKQKNFKWVFYRLILNDDGFFHYDYMRKFVSFIKNSKRKKIYLCNSTNNRLKEFFNIDEIINIPPRNWSNNYSTIKKEVERVLEKNCILLTSGGLCSKVLINDLTNQYKISCIDLGSGFDFLGSKRMSRNHKHCLNDELNYYDEFIPTNWRE